MEALELSSNHRILLGEEMIEERKEERDIELDDKESRNERLNEILVDQHVTETMKDYITLRISLLEEEDSVDKYLLINALSEVFTIIERDEAELFSVKPTNIEE